MANTGKKKTVSSMYGTTGNRKSRRTNPMVKKMIDLSESGTIGAANQTVSVIRRNFVRVLKDYNVAVLAELATDPNIVANYFINRKLYATLLGDNIRLLDLAMRDTIAEYITAEIRVNFNKADTVHPGYWSTENIYALVHTMVNVITLSDGSELGEYLSALRVPSGEQVTKADVATAPAMMCMRFVEYNANRLYQFCTAVANTATTIILKESNERIPTMLRTAWGETVITKLARELSEVIKESTIPVLTQVSDTDDAVTEKFIDVFDRVLFGYVIVCLNQSGVRPELINALFDSPRKLSATYTEGKEGGDWTSRSVTYVIREDTRVLASITFRIADIYAILDYPKAKGVQINRVGKSVKLFLDALIRAVITGVVAGTLRLTENQDGTTEKSTEADEGDAG